MSTLTIGQRAFYARRSTHTLEPVTIVALSPWTLTATCRRDSDQKQLTIKIENLVLETKTETVVRNG